eukprot:TRINITY_DN2739_c0_g1_i5.p3 TRINITY_DN2739_c0_g1~~TRINITY_DN2739_c0_g1_i5.p3  ORF type:complete len:119 (-),score=49.10 TRINITY_DN2739_c0_g1_i5:144-500(-)
MAMLKLDAMMAPIGGCIIMQIHDELVVEVPQQKVDAAAEALRGCMETAAVLRVPLRVNLSVGTRWGSLAPLRPATAAAAATDAAATAAPAAQDSDDDGAQWAADDADDFDEGGGFGVL